jgi:hypothetical protein
MPIALPLTTPVTVAGLPQWFRARVTTAGGGNVDVSKYLKTVSISRGRTSGVESSVAAATCSCTFDDTAGTFDPDNLLSPLAGMLTVGPTSATTFRLDHYVAAIDAYKPLFTGPFESLERSFTGGLSSETAATFVDSTPEISRHVPPAGTVLPAELPGARIARLLATASRSGVLWTTRALVAPTALDTGQKMLTAYICDGTTSSWRIAEGAAQAEGGLLFFDPAGVLTFRGQARRLVQNPVWTFSDAPADTIRYETDVKFRLSTDTIIDDAAVTTADGITSYFGPSGAFSDNGTARTGANPFKDKVNAVTVDLTETSQLTGRIVGASRARYLYQSRMPPRRHVPTLTLNPAPIVGQWVSGGNPTAYQAAVSVMVDDLALVIRTPAGGGTTISQLCWVEGFQMQATSPDSWTVSLNVSRADPLPPLGFWRLGVSRFGLNTTLTW